MSLILTLLLAFADHTSAGHALDQVAVADGMAEEYGIQVDLAWQPCGFENAFYLAFDNAIVFCMDNEDGWEQTAAHEMGHAVIFQRGLDPGSDPKADERGADELGTLWLLEHKMYDAVADGAAKYLRWAKTDPPVPEDDPHPPSKERAWELLCLLDGATGGSPECQGLYAMKKAYWDDQLRRHPAP